MGVQGPFKLGEEWPRTLKPVQTGGVQFWLLGHNGTPSGQGTMADALVVPIEKSK
jgi:hypothetical protein